MSYPDYGPVYGPTFSGAHARITYRGDYSVERPWYVYIRGTAITSFTELSAAQLYLRLRGYEVSSVPTP